MFKKFLKQLSCKSFISLLMISFFIICVIQIADALDEDIKFNFLTQRTVSMDTPLNRVQFLGAHNAWNNSSNVWANQRWSLETLLDNGIQSFDLDLHWDEGKVKLCHGGCGSIWSADDDYPAELEKIAKFARSHPKILLFIDLEDRVGRQAEVEHPIYETFGSLLYKPSDKPGNRWETPREMLAKGKRVIVKSANNTYDGSLIWHGHIFAVNAPDGFNYQKVKYFDSNNCTSGGIPITQDEMFGFYDSKLGKSLLPDKWVDDTGTVDEDNIPEMLKCGVNFVDADRWSDSLVKAAVWTWADNEPNNLNNEDCAIQTASGRWNDVACSRSFQYACQSTNNPDSWKVTSASGTWENGFHQCSAEFSGYTFSTPANAYQNKLLLQASNRGTTYLAYSDMDNEGNWDIYNKNIPMDWTVNSYGVNLDINKTLRIPGIAQMKVKVLGSIQSGGDYIYIYDSNRKLLKTYTGSIDDLFMINDSSIIVRLKTNASVSGNFKIVLSDEGISCHEECHEECQEEESGCDKETVCNTKCKTVCK